MKIAFDVDVLSKQMSINDLVHQVADWGYKYIEQSPHPRINPFYKHPLFSKECEEEYRKAVQISEALFGGDLQGLSADDILLAAKQVPNVKVEEGQTLIDLLVNNKICSSRREAREMLAAGAISINNERHSDENEVMDSSKAIDGRVFIIRKGKKKQYIGLI